MMDDEIIRTIPLADPMPREVTVAEAAKVLLAAWESGIGGDKMADKDAFHRLVLAASFGAEAFDMVPIHNAKPAAMIRSLLQAACDPDHPSLDWLRACNQPNAPAGKEEALRTALAACSCGDVPDTAKGVLSLLAMDGWTLVRTQPTEKDA